MESEKEITHWEKYVQELPLMGSHVPIILIITSYLLFILKIGPNFMRNRPAYDLSNIMLIYNCVQVVVSFILMCTSVAILKQFGIFYSICHWDKDSDNMLFLGYLFMLIKITGFLDTVFFVLRKKQSQVTFLHIYHHSLMVILSWIFLKYEPSFIVAFLGAINSFIHVVMYTYYGLAAIPGMRKYLWWKKYLTMMQMIQFGLFFIQVITYMKLAECPPSNIILVPSILNVIFITCLFAKFYINTYLGKDVSEIDMGRFVCFKVERSDNEIDHPEFSKDTVANKND